MTLVANSTLSVKSPAFANNEFIPPMFTCDGLNVNPELNVGDIPKDTKSLALIMEDPDAPKGTYDHWIMWNIPPRERIEENSAPGAQGRNSRGENKYYGPCPPEGLHHYYFRVYALDTRFDLPITTNKEKLLEAMTGHILAIGEIVGIYKKN